MKEINLIFPFHEGEDCFRFQNEFGRVMLSNKRNPNKINVFMGSDNPAQPEDSVLILEPITVNPCDYDLQNLKRFRYIFGFAEQAYTELGNKFIKINYPSTLTKKSIEYIAPYMKKFRQRQHQVGVVANIRQSDHASSIYPLRLALADFLYQNKIDVHWYGGCALKKPYYKGRLEDKLKFLCNCKFTICSENTYDPIYSHNYLTEKMPQAWFSGCVPLYMGCYNIDDLGFSPNMYIDLRKHVHIIDTNNYKINSSILDVIHKYDDSDYQNYLHEMVLNFKSQDGFTDIINYENVFRKMVEVL
jgi:hypothetical protein